VWGGCKAPTCVEQTPRGIEHTRLMNCSAAGCRLEVFHDGLWGRVNGVWSNTSAEVACRSLGLRGRPLACGRGGCGAAVGEPAVVPPPPLYKWRTVWLTNVSCTGFEASIHDCPSNLTTNVSFSTNSEDKWGYFASSASTFESNDAGVCCWPMPSFMGHMGLRTREEYGHIFKTISALDRQGQETEPAFCCQEHSVRTPLSMHISVEDSTC